MLWGCQEHRISLLLQSNLCVLASLQGQASQIAGSSSPICFKLQADKDRQLQAQCLREASKIQCSRKKLLEPVLAGDACLWKAILLAPFY